MKRTPNDDDRSQASAIVTGPRAVEALLRTPERIRRIWLSDQDSGTRRRIKAAAEAAELDLREAPTPRLDKLADGLRHQGVVAEVAPLDFTPWADLLAPAEGLLVAFDQVTDPRNLGASLRSAEAFGARGALVTRNRCARPGPVVSRTSAGASEIIPVAIETNLARALREAKQAGYRVVGADMEGEALHQADLSGPIVLVIGAEGPGLRRLTRELCDLHVRIPMSGLTESLNASVAASIILYEINRGSLS